MGGALEVVHRERDEADLENGHVVLVPEHEEAGGLDVDEEHGEEVRKHGGEHELLEEEASRRRREAAAAAQDHLEDVAAVGVVGEHAEAGVRADERLGLHDVRVGYGAAQHPQTHARHTPPRQGYSRRRSRQRAGCTHAQHRCTRSGGQAADLP